MTVNVLTFMVLSLLDFTTTRLCDGLPSYSKQIKPRGLGSNEVKDEYR